MWTTSQKILERTLDQLSGIANLWVPSLLAGAVFLLCAWVLAGCARWLVNHIFKGVAADRFLRQSGLAGMLDRTGRLRARQLAAGGVFWLILATGILGAVNAFDTELTRQAVASVVFLAPKIITAGLIVLAGAWLGQYLGRSALVWICNEGFPGARRWAAAVRLVIIFVSVVVAADTLDFARGVFLAAFVMLVGGAVLAVALALGLGLRDAVRRQIEGALDRGSAFERSLHHHL